MATWELVPGNTLAKAVEALLWHLARTVDVQVVEGGEAAKELVEALRSDIEAAAAELSEKLVLHRDVLERCVFVDYDAPPIYLTTDVPPEETTDLSPEEITEVLPEEIE
jgi:hypothetical protein